MKPIVLRSVHGEPPFPEASTNPSGSRFDTVFDGTRERTSLGHRTTTRVMFTFGFPLTSDRSRCIDSSWFQKHSHGSFSLMVATLRERSSSGKKNKKKKKIKYLRTQSIKPNPTRPGSKTCAASTPFAFNMCVHVYLSSRFAGDGRPSAGNRRSRLVLYSDAVARGAKTTTTTTLSRSCG